MSAFASRVLLVSLLLAATAEGIQHRYERCLRYLFSQQIRHGTHVPPSLAAERRKAAIETLIDFRLRQLGGMIWVPGNAEAIASHDSSVRTKRLAARRVSGIIEESGAQTTTGLDPKSGKGFQRILAASLYEGEDVEAHLLDRMEWAKRFSQTNRYELNRENALAVVLPIVGSFNLMALTFAFFGDPLGPILWFFSRDLVEGSIRQYRVFDLSQVDEPLISNRLGTLSDEQWHYTSFDTKFPKNTLIDSWRTGEISSSRYRRLWNFAAQAKWTKRLTSRVGMGLTFDDDSQEAWLRVDELLRLNPRTQLPELVVVTRIIEELPPYPKKVPSPKQVRVPSTAPVWQPGLQPAGG